MLAVAKNRESGFFPDPGQWGNRRAGIVPAQAPARQHWLHWQSMTPYLIHTIFEAAAYMLGFRLFLRERRRRALPALADRDAGLAVVVGGIVGAAVGAKMAYWLYDPAYAFSGGWARLLEGKSIIGALLGGLSGVEIAKKLDGIQGSTGDAFVWPLMLGMGIGRIGCFLSGLNDHTAGNPTALPWGVDFGDGIARHPTQLYEVMFLALWAALLAWRGKYLKQAGDLFRAFMVGYLSYRLCIEFIRPMPMQYFGFLSGLQLLCIAGLLDYHRDIGRIAKGLLWARK
jgi:prolipoprotein diacylglyceryltransferase